MNFYGRNFWEGGMGGQRQVIDCTLFCGRFIMHRNTKRLNVVCSSLYQTELGAAN